MGKVFSICSLNTDTESSCLSVTKIGAAPYLKILFLSWGPCFNITRFYFQVCQISGTAFQSTNRYIHRTEKVNRILPQIIIPFHTFLWLTYNNHLLLLKLMNSVDSSLFNSMSSFFFTETRRIAGQCLRKLLFCKHLSNKFSNHGMFTGSNQIKVFSFYLIHHGIHLCKTHNAGNYITSYHKWRNTVCEASSNHKITGIGQHSRMKPCNVAH